MKNQNAPEVRASVCLSATIGAVLLGCAVALGCTAPAQMPAPAPAVAVAPPPPPPSQCPPLPLLKQPATAAERDLHHHTVIALYAQCAGSKP